MEKTGHKDYLDKVRLFVRLIRYDFIMEDAENPLP